MAATVEKQINQLTLTTTTTMMTTTKTKEVDDTKKEEDEKDKKDDDKKDAEDKKDEKDKGGEEEAEEEDKEFHVLSNILPDEEINCCLGDKCLLGNAKSKEGNKKMEYKQRQWHEKCFACCVCKTPIGTKSFIPKDQDIYCAGCYEEKFATRCVKCDKIITSGGVTYKSEPWHRECFTCTHCNTSLAGQRFTSKDDKPYCADCFGELFAKRCTACTKPITGIGGTRFISFEDRHWHNDCFICAVCKDSLVGKGFITDGADILCPECAKQKLM